MGTRLKATSLQCHRNIQTKLKTLLAMKSHPIFLMVSASSPPRLSWRTVKPRRSR